MAMIKCFECDRPVSDSAEACPGCGAGVAESIWEHDNEIVHVPIVLGELLPKVGDQLKK